MRLDSLQYEPGIRAALVCRKARFLMAAVAKRLIVRVATTTQRDLVAAPCFPATAVHDGHVATEKYRAVFYWANFQRTAGDCFAIACLADRTVIPESGCVM